MEKHCYMKIVLFVIITGPIVAFEIIDRVHSPLLPGGWQREKTFFLYSDRFKWPTLMQAGLVGQTVKTSFSVLLQLRRSQSQSRIKRRRHNVWDVHAQSLIGKYIELGLNP
jgi:hypothetical protein